jgi:hypothetical protein
LKNILFIVSHLGSGYESLIYSLNKNERIDIKSLQLSYAHPEVLEYLYESGHKLDNSASFYGDLILFNKNFSCNAFYKFSKFIFFINSPLNSLNEICKTDKLSEKEAFRYYSFRLRRIYEMAVNSNNNFVFITYDDLINKTKFSLIENYLNLKNKLSYPEIEISKSKNFISSDLLMKANDCYEKYLFLMKSLV